MEWTYSTPFNPIWNKANYDNYHSIPLHSILVGHSKILTFYLWRNHRTQKCHKLRSSWMILQVSSPKKRVRQGNRRSNRVTNLGTWGLGESWRKELNLLANMINQRISYHTARHFDFVNYRNELRRNCDVLSYIIWIRKLLKKNRKGGCIVSEKWRERAELWKP